MTLIASFLNGESSDVLSVRDRGLSYGDGLFETLAVVNRKIPLLDRHISRLEQGLAVLKLPADVELIKKHLGMILNLALPNFAVAKLIVTRGESGRGYLPVQSTPNILLQVFASDFQIRDRVLVHSCRQTLGHQPELAGLKTLCALPYVLAAAERVGTHFDEGLLFDQNGSLVEATARNVFIVVDNTLITPNLDACGVNGVMRAYVMDWAASEKIDVLEKMIHKSDLDEASELFLTNSVTGVWSVRAWYDSNDRAPRREWPMGLMAKKLQKHLSEQIFL